jgi:hypothetical protein
MRKPVVASALALVLAAALSSTPASADDMTVGAELVPIVPIGNFSDVSAFGIGALGAFDYWLMPQLRLTGRTGFLYHVTKGDGVSFSAIPVWAGARYHFEDRAGAWVGGELGPNILLTSIDLGALGSHSDTEVKLGIGVGGGYMIDKLDLGLRAFSYDIGHFGDSFAIAALVGYHFAEL